MGADDKRLVGFVPMDVWHKMLMVGHSLDLNKGGLYDSRSGAVNVWASPEDKPDGWGNVEILPGGLDYPRALVGTVSFERTEELKNDEWIESAKIFIEPSPSERWEADGISSRLEKAVLESEWNWLIEKTFQLMLLAVSEIEPPEGLFCRFCDAYVKVALLNDFIVHLQEEHNVVVKSVTLGEKTVIETETGTIEV